MATSFSTKFHCTILRKHFQFYFVFLASVILSIEVWILTQKTLYLKVIYGEWGPLHWLFSKWQGRLPFYLVLYLELTFAQSRFKAFIICYLNWLVILTLLLFQIEEMHRYSFIMLDLLLSVCFTIPYVTSTSSHKDLIPRMLFLCKHILSLFDIWLLNFNQKPPMNAANYSGELSRELRLFGCILSRNRLIILHRIYV